jgi:hypothetical protein
LIFSVTLFPVVLLGSVLVFLTVGVSIGVVLLPFLPVSVIIRILRLQGVGADEWLIIVLVVAV